MEHEEERKKELKYLANIKGRKAQSQAVLYQASWHSTGTAQGQISEPDIDGSREQRGRVEMYFYAKFTNIPQGRNKHEDRYSAIEKA